jgi:hypothetical protein
MASKIKVQLYGGKYDGATIEVPFNPLDIFSYKLKKEDKHEDLYLIKRKPEKYKGYYKGILISETVADALTDKVFNKDVEE